MGTKHTDTTSDQSYDVRSAWEAPPITPQSQAVLDMANQPVSADPATADRFASMEEEVRRSYADPQGAYTTPFVRQQSQLSRMLKLRADKDKAMREDRFTSENTQFGRKVVAQQITQPNRYVTGGSSQGTTDTAQHGGFWGDLAIAAAGGSGIRSSFMIDQVKKDLGPLIDRHAGTIGLCLSGGSDSLLLLHILLDMKAKFSCLTFDHSYSREQKDLIDELVQEFKLKVFSYPPANAILIGDGKQVSLVEEYPMIDGYLLPFLRDAIHDDTRCVYEVEFGPFIPTAPLGLTLLLFGTRKTDRHYATGRPWKAQTWQRRMTTYHAPLWEMTRKDVAAGLRHYGVRAPKIDTGEIALCTKCLNANGPVVCPKSGEEIPAFDWQPQVMLNSFRERHGFV